MIEHAYQRRAEVVPPPIDTDLFMPSGSRSSGYFLFVGRLVEAYKRPSIAVEAFARMPDLKLLVAGDGPARAQLQSQATENVEFLGSLADHELVKAMQGCEAVVFPSADDFGLVPLEANACGRPVIALRAGGALHTVRPGVSGEFMEAQTADEIVRAVRSFDPKQIQSEAMRNHALQWSAQSFRSRIRAAVEQVAADSPIRASAAPVWGRGDGQPIGGRPGTATRSGSRSSRSSRHALA